MNTFRLRIRRWSLTINVISRTASECKSWRQNTYLVLRGVRSVLLNVLALDRKGVCVGPREIVII